MQIKAQKGQFGPCVFPVIHAEHMNVSDQKIGHEKRCVRVDNEGRTYLRLDWGKYLTSDMLRDMADTLDAHSGE